MGVLLVPIGSLFNPLAALVGFLFAYTALRMQTTLICREAMAMTQTRTRLNLSLRPEVRALLDRLCERHDLLPNQVVTKGLKLLDQYLEQREGI